MRRYHIPATRVFTFGPPDPRPTRYKELGFAQHAPGLWRIIDMSTNAAVGAMYRTKAELMGDLDRYAKDFGCEIANPGNK